MLFVADVYEYLDPSRFSLFTHYIPDMNPTILSICFSATGIGLWSAQQATKPSELPGDDHYDIRAPRYRF